MVFLLSFYFFAALLISVGFMFRYQPLLKFTIGNSMEMTDFVFTLAGLAMLTLYIKTLTESQIDRFDSLNKILKSKINESKKANQKLNLQHKELEGAQEILEREVNAKSKSIESKNMAIGNYIRFNTHDLQRPIANLNEQISTIKGTDTMSILLKASYEELNSVLENIKTTFDSDETLDRTKIGNR
jgi:23S rRNA maturation mini-RNase III